MINNHIKRKKGFVIDDLSIFQILGEEVRHSKIHLNGEILFTMFVDFKVFSKYDK